MCVHVQAIALMLLAFMLTHFVSTSWLAPTVHADPRITRRGGGEFCVNVDYVDFVDSLRIIFKRFLLFLVCLILWRNFELIFKFWQACFISNFCTLLALCTIVKVV